MSLTIHSKDKYFDSTVQRAVDRWQKFHFCRLPFDVNVMLNLSNGNAVHAKFHKSIQFNKDSGRYTVKLPWRDTAEDLPSNFALSKKRLVNLQCSLNKRDPEHISKYDEQLQSQVKQGFIEVVKDPSIHSGK